MCGYNPISKFCMSIFKTNIVRNIFALPTDNYKNVRLSLFNDKLYLWDVASTAKPQHIYITNDEVVKNGEWCLEFDYGDKPNVVKWEFQPMDTSDYKKIILTTDPDLIKDGVQPIPDEFLEWFVKNQSCEFVEVKKSWFGDSSSLEGKYQIIIPKEEATIELYMPKYTIGDNGMCDEVAITKDEQELDEFRKNYVEGIDGDLLSERTIDTIKAFCSDAIEQTAKWVKEKENRDEFAIEFQEWCVVNLTSGKDEEGVWHLLYGDCNQDITTREALNIFKLEKGL